MNQIFSIILVIVMAFSSMTGMMSGIEDAVSFEVKIGVDSDELLSLSAATGTEVPEETQQVIKVAGSILDALTLKGVATKDSAELVLLAGADVALSIGVKNEEKGSTVASSLLSSDVIFVSAELIEQMKQQMTQSMGNSGMDMSAMETVQNLDKEQIEKDSEEVRGKLIEAIEAKKGETETGEFTVDGMTFTAKTPVNMTYTEFAELFLTGVKELAEKESMKPIMQMYKGEDIGAEIDKTIENIKNQPEEEKPDFELTIYTNEDNNAYYVCNMTKKSAQEGTQDQMVHVGFSEVDGHSLTVANINASGQQITAVSEMTKEGAMALQALVDDSTSGTRMEILADKDEAGKLNAEIIVNKGKDKVKVLVAAEPADGERVTFSIGMYYNDADKPLITLTGSAGKGGETVSVFEGEKLNTVPIETLMDPNNTTVSGQMQMKLMAGLLKSITVVTKNVPEDAANWINGQIQQMMAPAAPQGN